MANLINVNRIVVTLETRAVDGLNSALNKVVDSAQKHAPVRAIFNRDRRGQTEVPRVVLPSGSSTADIMRAYRAHRIAGPNQYKRWQRARVEPRRMDIPDVQLTRPPRERNNGPYKNDREGFKYESQLELTEGSGIKRGPNRGEINSEIPVMRSQGETVMGDFRQVRGGKLVPVSYFHQMKGGQVSVRTPEAPKGYSPVSFAENELTRRGEYEVRTGRANIRTKSGRDQVGGALKHSIRKINATLATRNGRGKIIGYVVAGNKKVKYARYQEFGTRRHRAHPFLRPALYENRQTFIGEVRRGLQGGKFKKASED